MGGEGKGRGVDKRGRGGKSAGLRMPCVTKESTTLESREEGAGVGEGQGTALFERATSPSVCMSMGTWLVSSRQASVTWGCPMGALAVINWDGASEEVGPQPCQGNRRHKGRWMALPEPVNIYP